MESHTLSPIISLHIGVYQTNEAVTLNLYLSSVISLDREYHAFFHDCYFPRPIAEVALRPTVLGTRNDPFRLLC